MSRVGYRDQLGAGGDSKWVGIDSDGSTDRGNVVERAPVLNVELLLSPQRQQVTAVLRNPVSQVTAHALVRVVYAVYGRRKVLPPTNFLREPGAEPDFIAIVPAAFTSIIGVFAVNPGLELEFG